MPENRDELIERIVDELKVLPAVPADATARVLARVDAARRGEGVSAGASDDDDVILFPTGTDEMQTAAASVGHPVPASAAELPARGGLRRRFVVSLPAAVGYALAATVAGFLIRGAMPRNDAAAVTGIAASERAVGETCRCRGGHRHSGCRPNAAPVAGDAGRRAVRARRRPRDERCARR